MTKKKKNRSKSQRKNPRESEMAEKDGDSTDHGLYHDVGTTDVKHCIKLLQNMISYMKLAKDILKKDHDHPKPSDLKKIELLPKLDEELRILKLKVADYEKEQQGIEHELVTMYSKLEVNMKNAVQRISEMKKYKDSGSVDMEELETIQLAGERLKEIQQNLDGLFARLMRDVICPTDSEGNPEYQRRNLKFSSQELKEIKKEIESGLTAIDTVEKSLDEYEEKFRKYNLPKLKNRSSESLDWYLERLREFMQSIWKEAAAKCRQKEHKSLIEWMLMLVQSEDCGKTVTFKALKVVFDHIGIRISRFLIQYFLLMSISADKQELAANLFKVESIIRCLIVEENSIVINNFVSVVKYFDETMRLANPFSDEKAKGKVNKIEVIEKDNSWIEKENDVLHLIIMEILRLEVAFSHPDLPMMLMDEVFLAMGKHLIDNVFEDKFNRVSARIDGLKSEFVSVQHKDSMRNSFAQVLDLGVQEIWNENKLDLK